MLEQYLVVGVYTGAVLGCWCVSQPLVQVTFIDWARPKIGCRQYKLISVFMFCQHETFVISSVMFILNSYRIIQGVSRIGILRFNR